MARNDIGQAFAETNKGIHPETVMIELSRRHSLAVAAGIALSMVKPYATMAANVRAMKRSKGDGQSLMRAVSRRRSIREYAQTEIPMELLADLLWTANGINRPETGGRTTPSWHGSYGSDLYVADEAGVWRFDPAQETISQVGSKDIRKTVSPQPFVATAPVVLLHITDLSRMYKAAPDEQVRYAYVDSAIIAQNIYLFCAANGLGTCLVGGVNAKETIAALAFKDTMLLTYVQPIGYPKS